jgi:hypothetical protein
VRRRALAAVSLVLVVSGTILAQAALGATTRDEFGTRVEQECAKASRQTDVVFQKLNNGKRTIEPDRNPQRAGKVILATTPILRRALRHLHRIPPPAGDEHAIATWLRYLNRSVSSFSAGGRALLDGNLPRWNRLADRALAQGERAVAAVEDFGFDKDCV